MRPLYSTVKFTVPVKVRVLSALVDLIDDVGH